MDHPYLQEIEMACPTCDHTMHGLGDRWFWCPRCGTVLNGDDREHTTSQTKLTEQVRAWLHNPQYITMAHLRDALSLAAQKPDERRGA